MPLSLQPLPRLLLLACLSAALLATPALASPAAASGLNVDAVEAALGRLELDVRVHGSLLPGTERDARQEAAERRQLERRVIDLRAIARHHGLEAPDWSGRWQALDEALGLQRPGAPPAELPSGLSPEIRARIYRADTGAEIGGALRAVQVTTGYEYVGYGEGHGEVVVYVPPGTYYVQAYPHFLHDDLLSEFFEDVYCEPQTSLDCDLSQATRVTLGASQTRSFDFNLEEQGRIEGTIRDARTQAPVALARVAAISSAFGTVTASAYAVGGVYSLGVPPGSYYLKVFADGDYLGQAYPGVLCMEDYSNCAPAGATPVQMVGRQIVTGIDFSLIHGAKVSGKVVDASTGQPIADGQVYLRQENGQTDRTAYTNSSGSWAIGGIPAGRYHLTVQASGYLGQYWPGLDCPTLNSCWELGDGITVAAESVQAGFDFQLKRLGSILGRVVDDQNASGVADSWVTLYSPSESGLLVVTNTTSDSAGAFHLSGLPPGDYYLKVEQPNYQPEVYQDLPVADFARDPALARKIHVDAGMVTGGVEVRLTRLGRIEGRIVDDATGQPLTYCDVYLWRVGDPQTAIRRDGFCADGKFSVGVEPGEYYLGARGDHADFAPTLLGVGPCNFFLDSNHCPLAQATKIALGAGDVRDGFELRLKAGATISAMVVAAANAIQTPIIVQLVDAQDRPAAVHYSYFNSSFDFRNLAPGDYWLAALGAPHNGNHLYPTGTCNRWYCDARQGQKLTVASGQQLMTEPLVVYAATPYTRCQPSAEAICLEQGRYQVQAFWQDYIGQAGPAQGQRLTDDSGYFTFFAPNNIELVVKVLNACRRDLGHRFWVFASGLTNVGVRLRITDTLSGEVYEQTNALGTPYPPLLDTAAFQTCDTPEPPPGVPDPLANAVESAATDVAPPAMPEVDAGANDPCTPGHAEICLAERRFRVRSYYGFGGIADQLAWPGRISEDAAYVSFFSEENVELLFKVIDACDVYGHFWVFATGLTDVYSKIVVEDTHTGQSKTYGGFDGPFQPIIDISTFSCH